MKIYSGTGIKATNTIIANKLGILIKALRIGSSFPLFILFILAF
jgi:hypothetical protein